MAENRNCPNCGAPYDVKLNKCPYCGTSYFDLTCMQIGYEPFYLKIKDPRRGIVVTQKCFLNSVDITLESSPIYCRDDIRLIESRDAEIDLNLTVLADNGTLCTTEVL